MGAPGFSETSAFVAVLEQKSFTRAAKQLGLSPPRVSELIRGLEESLGVRLVERTTRSVAATAAGERLLARLRPVRDEYEAALDSLNDLRAKPAGTLRLTVPPPAAEFLLAPVITQFLKAYPDVKLDVSVDDALTDIVAERYDAGIRAGHCVARDMIGVRISDRMQIVVVASPTYLVERGTPKTPQDLERHNCIRIRFPSGVFLPWRFGSKRRSLEARADGSLVVNDTALAIRAVSDGLGLMQFARVYFAPMLADGRLVTVLDDWAPPPFEGFYLYYPSRRQIRPALKVFIDFLRSSHRAKRCCIVARRGLITGSDDGIEPVLPRTRRRYLQRSGLDINPKHEMDNIGHAVSMIAATRAVAYAKNFLPWSVTTATRG